jgi:hypothetical protein
LQLRKEVELEEKKALTAKAKEKSKIACGCKQQYYFLDRKSWFTSTDYKSLV